MRGKEALIFEMARCTVSKLSVKHDRVLVVITIVILYRHETSTSIRNYVICVVLETCVLNVFNSIIASIISSRTVI